MNKLVINKFNTDQNLKNDWLYLTNSECCCYEEKIGQDQYHILFGTKSGSNSVKLKSSLHNSILMLWFE